MFIFSKIAAYFNRIHRFNAVKKYTKSLGIKLCKWQSDYILTGNHSILCEQEEEQVTGKTFAVMMRALLLNPSSASDLLLILKADPDFSRISLKSSFEWYILEYKDHCLRFRQLGYQINEISRLDFMRFYHKVCFTWWDY